MLVQSGWNENSETRLPIPGIVRGLKFIGWNPGLNLILQEKLVRTVWDDEQEKWYFSIVDVVQAITDQPDFQKSRNYWKVLKNRLIKEGNETVTNCNRLKLLAEDGKMRLTDVADSEQMLRLIQSIPSPKTEPFKQWLAQIAKERIDELQDPKITIDRIFIGNRGRIKSCKYNLQCI